MCAEDEAGSLVIFLPLKSVTAGTLRTPWLTYQCVITIDLYTCLPDVFLLIALSQQEDNNDENKPTFGQLGLWAPKSAGGIEMIRVCFHIVTPVIEETGIGDP